LSPEPPEYQQQHEPLQPRPKLSQLPHPQAPEKIQEPQVDLSKVMIKFNKDHLEEFKAILYSQFGDMMRALGQNPTNAKVLKFLENPKSDELKSQHVDFETFLLMLQVTAKNRNQGTYEDYLEGLHVFDKEGNSKVTGAELRQVLITLGEKMAEEEMETVLAGHEDTINEEAFLKHYEAFLKHMVSLLSSVDPWVWAPAGRSMFQPPGGYLLFQNKDKVLPLEKTIYIL
uniref:EF-hand domain-containing protein n=1 Tax=Theropithecus gelada TaxID=9565 RepID=A0A8D2EFK1_THEGE